MPVQESVALSVATAGSAVCFAGLTVVIALAGLLVVGIPFLSTMGLGAAGTVVLAVLIANTMLPALLGFAGTRAAKRRKPAPEHPWGERWGRHVTSHPVAADPRAGRAESQAGRRRRQRLTAGPQRIDQILPNVDIEGKHLQPQPGDRLTVQPTEA